MNTAAKLSDLKENMMLGHTNRPVEITTKLNIVIPHKGKDALETQKRDRIHKTIGLVISYILLIIAAIIVIFPFYYMIIATFMTEHELINGAIWPHEGNAWENVVYNFTETLNRFDYKRYVGNTLIVAVSETALGLLNTILAAFAFARLNFRGRDLLFTLFLGTMMIPGEMMVISNYATMSNLGLLDKQTTGQAYVAMVLPFLSSVFYIYLLRQNFKQIPNELYLAAKVDGKSDWEYLWKVMVPLASPTIITIIILNFIGAWNGYIWPNLVTRNNAALTISVAVRQAELYIVDQNEQNITQYTWQMVASLLTVVPLLILFIIFRKYIMRGTSRAGIKG